MTRAYVCVEIRVHPLLGPDLLTCLQNIKGNLKIQSRETIQKLSRGDNNSWPAYQIYWHTRSTQNISVYKALPKSLNSSEVSEGIHPIRLWLK